MSDEDFILSQGSPDLSSEDDHFEEMLEILIKIARSEKREFLAYLLRMALIEARNHSSAKTYLSH